MPWKARIKYEPVLDSPMKESLMNEPGIGRIIDFIGEGKTFGEIFDNFVQDEGPLPEQYEQRGNTILKIQRELFSKLNSLVKLKVLSRRITGIGKRKLDGFLREYLGSEYVTSDLSKGRVRSVPKAQRLEGMGFSGAALEILPYKNPFAFEFLEPHSERVQELLQNYYDELVDGLRKEGSKKTELEKTASQLLRKGFTLDKLRQFADTHGLGLGAAVRVALIRRDPEGFAERAGELTAEHGLLPGIAARVAERSDSSGVVGKARELVDEHGLGLTTAANVAQRSDPDGVMGKAREIVAEYGIGPGTAVTVARGSDPDGVMRKASEISTEQGVGMSIALRVAMGRDPDGVVGKARELAAENGLEMWAALRVAMRKDPDGTIREARKLVDAYRLQGLELGTALRVVQRKDPEGTMKEATRLAEEQSIPLTTAIFRLI